MMMWDKFLCTVGMAFTLSLGSVNANESNELGKGMDIRYILLKNLEAFASENSLSMKEVFSILNDLTYNQELISSKGGMGLIKGDVFVNLRSEKNNLFFNKNGDEWVGEDKKSGQVIFLSEGRLCEASIIGSTKDIVVIIFSENKVKYIDLELGMGGVYARN